MPETHQHVDLGVLQLVERLLGYPDDDAPAAADLTPLGHLRPAPEGPDDETARSHPAAHVPDLPVIARQPVTPLPRRR
jgi:hypothetical protein